MNILAFDVGGSHIAAARVARGVAGKRWAAPLDPDGSAAAILAAWRHIARCAAGSEEIAGAAVAFPRPFDYATGVCRTRHKFAALYGRDLRPELAAALGLKPDRVRFVNDADAFLTGAARTEGIGPRQRVMGVTLGTGLGSAFWADGGIVENGPGVPEEGEIWALPWRGGTLEDAISSRAVAQAYAARGGERLTAEAIAARAAAGEARARDAWAELGRELGRGIAPIVAAFRPDDLLLGGAMSRAAPWFLPAAEAALGPGRVQWRVCRALDTAALLGAAEACFPREGVYPGQ